MTTVVDPRAQQAEDMEKLCANRALQIVKDAGGAVTFDDYDDAYSKLSYAFVPFHWAIVGLDFGPGAQKKNQGILSVRKAVELGLLTRTAMGYELPQ